MDYIVILGIAEQWKKFGIDVVFNSNAAESTLVLHGEFEVDSVSHGEFAGEHGLHPDLYRCLNAL